MNGDLITEVLAAQAERLAAEEFDEIAHYLDLFPAAAHDLEPLLLLAQEVARLFQPRHAPRADWREELKRDLLAEHHQRQIAAAARWGTGRTWAAVGVGVGGAAVAVAAGLIIYWRGRQMPPAA